MEKEQLITSKRRQLVSVANSMLSGDMNLIEGVRKICALRFAVEDPDNDVFLPIRAIESETDAFPLGLMREKCNPEYLKRMDIEVQLYLSNAKDDILQACKDIIRAFS